MDEPTNHLDMKSKNVLKNALKNFDGTLIVVSHDRDFLQGLSNKVFEFKDRKIKEYLGDIDYFLEQRNLQHLREAEKRSDEPKKQLVSISEGKRNYEQQKKLKSLQNKLSKIESNINKLEREIKEIDVELQINYEETIAKANFFDHYQQKKEQLETLMETWETVSEELEKQR